MLTREAITDPERLTAAYREARCGKRRDRAVDAWFRDSERRLEALRARLLDGYRFGPYRTFTVCDPKTRLIAAAPFEDRVVHHAIVSALGPALERRMISTSFACRVGLGGAAARSALLASCRSERSVCFAKCDVRRYFPSVRHDVLLDQLGRVCVDPWGRALLASLIGSWHTDGTPGRGIPIGNLTSQLFANVYLTDVDHFMKRTARARGYMRYVDDLLWFGEDRDTLSAQISQLSERLAPLGLELHPRKTRVARVCDGVDFAGVVATKRTVRLRGATKRRGLRHLAAVRRKWRRGAVSDARYLERMRSLIALARAVGARGFLAKRGLAW